MRLHRLAFLITKTSLPPTTSWSTGVLRGDTFVYAVAGHRQNYPTLLIKRLLRI